VSDIGVTIPRNIIGIIIHTKAQHSKYNAFYAGNKNVSMLYLTNCHHKNGIKIRDKGKIVFAW
jgi:hypothetical protein